MGRKVSGRRNMEELECLWVCVWLVIKLGLCVGNVCWLLGTDQWNVKDRESSRCCEGPTLSAFKEPESLISAEASIFQAIRDTFAFYNSYFRVGFAYFFCKKTVIMKNEMQNAFWMFLQFYITVKICNLKILFSMSNMSLICKMLFNGLNLPG